MPNNKLDRVRVAMIGAGSMANNVHYPSLASFDDVEIAAICDLDTTRLQRDGGQIRRRAALHELPRRWSSRSRPTRCTPSGRPHTCTTSGCGACSRA